MNPFWFVWNLDGNAPRYKHPNLQSAISESERLAGLHPGQTFVVLQSVCGRCVDAMQRIDLTPPSRFGDEIPF